MPVKTIARPCSSAAAMTSSSRREPPGWITAVAPARATTSSPSRNGKNASDAHTVPAVSSPLSRARITARRAESTRFIWPAPTPTTWSRVVSTIAFDFACLPTRQAKRSASSSAAVGARFDTVLRLAGSRSARSVVCTSKPPRTPRYSASRARKRLDDGGVQSPVDAHDAAVDRDRIRRLRPHHGGADGRGARGAAGIRVLDDDRRGLRELEQERQRRGEVEEIVVAELRAVELLHSGQADRRRADLTVERRLLVRVLAVAERQHALGLESQRGRKELAPLARLRRARRQIRGDGRVVLRRPPERVLREPEARLVAQRPPARPQLVEDRGVLRRRGDDGHARVVLRPRPDHRRSADVDLLDRLVARHAGPDHGLLERIEGADDQVDGRDPVLFERGEM